MVPHRAPGTLIGRERRQGSLPHRVRAPAGARSRQGSTGSSADASACLTRTPGLLPPARAATSTGRRSAAPCRTTTATGSAVRAREGPHRGRAPRPASVWPRGQVERKRPRLILASIYLPARKSVAYQLPKAARFVPGPQRAMRNRHLSGCPRTICPPSFPPGLPAWAWLLL